MIVIKDTMALIHLAKLSMLEKSCDYFKKVFIPEQVYKEFIKGEEKELPDVPITLKLIKDKKIIIKKANQFNIQRGEADAVALYWQEKANALITDDDNIRKKRILLNIGVIGTPAIILKLYNKGIIDELKIRESISELRKIGWFNNSILDKILMEVEK